MRVLALADRPFHVDVQRLAAQRKVDAILTLGDLQPSWLETLDRVHLPKLGVYGNHDGEPYMEWFGIDDLHLRRLDLESGLSFCGFEGCVTYHRETHGRQGPTYSQKEAGKLMRKLPQASVLVIPCPPLSVNDDAALPAHVGFRAL